ncbi:hypothetical protein [Thauera humireducens]|uniref:Uncharacterized protein n=1 Tax=Thauera humireducens TaxID=1134435 RepID=A0A127K2R0_9RHOO|nr:hypothetical protein [Thauera humireducens]AMO36233.1 hypothetical protein AC731_004360 [Thauera humireducens]
MTIEKEKGAVPFESAPHITDANDFINLLMHLHKMFDPVDPVVFMPTGVTECWRCGCDVTPENVGMLKRLADLGSNASICATFCQSCAEAIDDEREAATRPPATSMTLPRRSLGKHPRRYPANGRALAEDPPALDQALNVAIGWPIAETLPAPKIIVQPEDDPARLRLELAAGRRVYVAHSAAANPEHLLKLAQTLIDYGALCVDLIVHPPRPGAGRERLRVVPEMPA